MDDCRFYGEVGGAKRKKHLMEHPEDAWWNKPEFKEKRLCGIRAYWKRLRDDPVAYKEHMDKLKAGRWGDRGIV